MTRIRELAEQTPATRARHVDLFRAVAITAVVVGHWLIMVVEYDRRGALDGTSALRDLTWAHPVTWLFQVMPLFFMVGGFANALSYQRQRERSRTPAQWLLDRGARLVRPTVVLLVALAAGAAVTRLLGAAPDQIGRAVWLATLPLWFLIAYLGVVALTPVMFRLHERAGLAVPVVLLVPVVAGDLLRFRYGEAWAYGNFAFAWLAIHQLGFAWRDGRFGQRAATGLLAGGLAGLVLLTVAGPYPVSMVTVPGAELQNSSPPSLALVALAAAQLGLVLLLAGPAERWLRRRRPWLAVVAANAVILTVFLWHMTAAVLTTVALHLLDRLPTFDVRSAEWLLWRVPWLAALAIVLAVLVAIVGRVETMRVAPAADRPMWLVAAGYVAMMVGLLWQALAGSASHGPFALPTGALVLFLAGAAVLLVVPRR
ncbi:MAG TPA: acyltransferase family protein [Natronosporangium sp.]